LEIYENATSEEDILRLAQIITNFIKIKPIVHYDVSFYAILLIIYTIFVLLYIIDYLILIYNNLCIGYIFQSLIFM